MGLGGQGARRDAGYAMAALLVMLAVMAVLMSAAMPVWKHQAQREKEAELVFRLGQYGIAIQLWQRKFQTYPPNIDVLVQQRFLRKKYKDPITGKDFEVIPAAAMQPGQVGPQRGQMPRPGQPSGFAAGGVMGVRSTSKENSIRVYKGATNYQQFTSILAMPMPIAPPGGGRGPGMDRPGMPGQGGRGPGGGRGVQPGGGRSPFGGVGPGGRGITPFPQPGGGRGPVRGGRGF